MFIVSPQGLLIDSDPNLTCGLCKKEFLNGFKGEDIFIVHCPYDGKEIGAVGKKDIVIPWLKNQRKRYEEFEWLNILDVEPKTPAQCTKDENSWLFFWYKDKIHYGFVVNNTCRFIKWKWFDECCKKTLDLEELEYCKPDTEFIEWWKPFSYPKESRFGNKDE